jgi:hypothetical protein
MVPSISFSGRECRHADKIFAFPARTEFSVTTGRKISITLKIPYAEGRCCTGGSMTIGVFNSHDLKSTLYLLSGSSRPRRFAGRNRYI